MPDDTQDRGMQALRRWRRVASALLPGILAYDIAAIIYNTFEGAAAPVAFRLDGLVFAIVFTAHAAVFGVLLIYEFLHRFRGQ